MKIKLFLIIALCLASLAALVGCFDDSSLPSVDQAPYAVWFHGITVLVDKYEIDTAGDTLTLPNGHYGMIGNGWGFFPGIYCVSFEGAAVTVVDRRLYPDKKDWLK